MLKTVLSYFSPYTEVKTIPDWLKEITENHEKENIKLRVSRAKSSKDFPLFKDNHTPPNMPEFVGIDEIQDASVLMQISTTLNSIAKEVQKFFQIEDKYRLRNISFILDRSHWDYWENRGHKKTLEGVTYGSYYTEQYRIAINPYLYIFCGWSAFLNTFYHELVHWVIDTKDFLTDEEYFRHRRISCHAHDFPIMNENINPLIQKGNKWNRYKNCREGKFRYLNLYVNGEKGLMTNKWLNRSWNYNCDEEDAVY